MKYLVLLRGINVGGNNIIKKDDLKSLFESVGAESVRTYIQSGNILFRHASKSKKQLSKKIAEALRKNMGKAIPVVLYTEKEYMTMMDAVPATWGKHADYKYNALFIIGDKDIDATAFPAIDSRYEQIIEATGVIFWSAAKKDYSRTSYAMMLVKSPLYKQVTIRNANTCFKLKELFDEL